MPTDPNITFGLTPLPNTQWNGDLNQLLTLFKDHLTGALNSGAFIGQEGGTEPLSDIGLWLNNNTWYKWSTIDGKYLPLPLVAGALIAGTLYTTRLVSGAKTANIDINLPDKNNGTLATLTDLATPSATVTQTGTPITIDWSQAGLLGRVYANISANTVVTTTGTPLDGQIIDLWIETPPSTGTAFTLTWPTGWIISAGALSTTDATHRAVDHIRIYQVATQTFVGYVKAFTVVTSGTGSDTTPPTVASIRVTSGTDMIHINFSEALRGGTLPTGDFSVKKNGVTNAVTSASASGSIVTLNVTNNYGSSATGTVQYTGTSIKDLAGNNAAVFGPSAIGVDATGSGGSGGGGGGTLPP